MSAIVMSEATKPPWLTMPLALDESGALFRHFRVMHVPTLLVWDAQGRLVRRIEGVDAQLPDELKALAQLSPPERTQSR